MTHEAISADDKPLLFAPALRKRGGVSPYLSSRLKRGLDLTASSMLILFLSALMGITAALIKLESSGPILFIQRRNGWRGEKFNVYKFRSMRHAPGAAFRQAARGDQRVTRIGRFIRRASIDELPQLFNVFKGEMSLVGPRPHPVPLDEMYGGLIDQYAQRFSAVPGLTGLAQVSGARGETADLLSMQRRIELDNRYVREATFIMDVVIIVKTVREVLSGAWRQEVY